MDIAKKMETLICNTIVENGYKLDEVRYEAEGSMMFLRVIIDKDGMIDIDDCVKVSKLINPLIDEADYIEENYVLDVCSKEKGCE